MGDNRRTALRMLVLAATLFALGACHASWHVPPGQIRKQQTPAATSTAPGQAKKY